MPIPLVVRGALVVKARRPTEASIADAELGKLDVSQASQGDSRKTARKRAQRNQRVAPAKQNADFETLEHSVYVGRRLLGRYERVSPKRYAAYDARGRRLGGFARISDALAAIDRVGGNQ